MRRGRIGVCTTKDLLSNASQAGKESGLNDWIMMRLGGRLPLYLALSTCDPMALDAFQ